MTDPTTSSPLAAAAHARAQDTRRRAEEALRQLDKHGRPITFAAVADAASVSRSWLYRQTDIRAEIDRLRAAPGAGVLPSAQRASAESARRQREALFDQIQRLKAENRQLREEVARMFGQQRASAT